MRLHELAKKIKMPSKDLLALATKLKIDIKSHMSILTASEVALLEKELKPKAAPAPVEKESKPAPVAKPVIGVTQINKGASKTSTPSKPVSAPAKPEIKAPAKVSTPAVPPPVTQEPVRPAPKSIPLKTQMPPLKKRW